MGRPWADVRETHTATVFFAGDRAFKVKKPVDLGFVDFRSREARHAACEEEVRLNRRLAPDVYLGVADVVADDGSLVDHLVVMRRMPEERRLSLLVRADSQLVDPALRDVARRLAALHEGAHVYAGADSPGSASAVTEMWRGELAEVEALAPGVVARERLSVLRRLAERYLTGRTAMLDERRRAGLVRDGHGDLLADDVFVLDDGARILDCLEFDERLRIADVWLDAAFLAMDLERLGRPDHARRFLAAYGEFGGHPAPASLVDFFIAYRAHVRAKVALVRRRQGERSATVLARRLLDLCREHLEAATVTLTLVGGLPGSGKTTLAAALADRTGAVHLSSDVIRGSGSPGSESAAPAYRQGRYADDVTEATYAELLTRAGTALRHGEPVVLDASWHDEAHRRAARSLAHETAAVLTEVRCIVPDEVARQWLEARNDRSRGARPSSDASEATVDTRWRMEREFAPWPTAARLDPRASDAVSAAADEIRRQVRQAARR